MDELFSSWKEITHASEDAQRIIYNSWISDQMRILIPDKISSKCESCLLFKMQNCIGKQISSTLNCFIPDFGTGSERNNE